MPVITNLFCFSGQENSIFFPSQLYGKSSWANPLVQMYLGFGPSPLLVRTHYFLRMWQNWPGLQAGHLEWSPKPGTDLVFNLLPFAPSNHFFQDDQLISPVEQDCTQILSLLFSLSGIWAWVKIVLQCGSIFLGGHDNPQFCFWLWRFWR